MSTDNNDLIKKNNKEYFEKKESEKKEYAIETEYDEFRYRSIIHNRYMQHIKMLEAKYSDFELKRSIQIKEEEEKYYYNAENNQPASTQHNEEAIKQKDIMEFEREIYKIDNLIQELSSRIESLDQKIKQNNQERELIRKEISDSIRNLYKDSQGEFPNDRSTFHIMGDNRFQGNLSRDREFYNKLANDFSDQLDSKNIYASDLDDEKKIRAIVENRYRVEIMAQLSISVKEEKEREAIAREIIKQPKWQNKISQDCKKVSKDMLKVTSLKNGIKQDQKKAREALVLQVEKNEAIKQLEKLQSSREKLLSRFSDLKNNPPSQPQRDELKSLISEAKALNIAAAQKVTDLDQFKNTMMHDGGATDKSLESIDDISAQKIGQIGSPTSHIEQASGCIKNMDQVVSAHENSMQSSFESFDDIFNKHSLFTEASSEPELHTMRRPH